MYSAVASGVVAGSAQRGRGVLGIALLLTLAAADVGPACGPPEPPLESRAPCERVRAPAGTA
eukprot:1628075-Lingulodinium_polyedra.AAC.1